MITHMTLEEAKKKARALLSALEDTRPQASMTEDIKLSFDNYSLTAFWERQHGWSITLTAHQTFIFRDEEEI